MKCVFESRLFHHRNPIFLMKKTKKKIIIIIIKIILKKPCFLCTRMYSCGAMFVFFISE